MTWKLTRSLGIVAIVGTIGLALSGDARACSCIKYYSGTYTEVPNHDAVFRGTVLELRVPWSLRVLDKEHPEAAQLALRMTDPTVTAVMEVDEWWRGELPRVVEIDAGTGLCCDCSIGSQFPGPGEELLVFAYFERDSDGERGDDLAVGICARPVSLAEASETLAAFGPGHEPVEPVEPRRSQGNLLLLMALATSGLAVAVGVGVWAVARGR